MIITRSPLRISLGGGGTDLPSYYREHGGALLAAAIDKYVYVSITRTFLDHLLVRYSRIETAASLDGIQHPIVREALALLDVREANLEITTMADIPAGTGLGSSGSFTTALLAALHRHRRLHIGPERLAAMACHIEIERLGEPIGKQDQYAAALGGVTWFEFHPDDTVTATALPLDDHALARMRHHLLLFSTGISRAAGSILAEQDRRTRVADAAMVENLHAVKRIGVESRDALLVGDLDAFGDLMHEHWARKKLRSGAMSSGQIDAWYELARANGARGGKLIGAGGGGFLMFQTPDPPRLRAAMASAGLPELTYDFDHDGTRLIER